MVGKETFRRTELPKSQNGYDQAKGHNGHNQSECQEQNLQLTKTIFLCQKENLNFKALVDAEIQAQTKELSSTLRQLAFSSVAISWILITLNSNVINLQIWVSLGATLAFFVFDLLQYSLTTIGLRTLHRLEAKTQEKQLKKVSKRSYIFYYFKVIFLSISYAMIVTAFVQQFWQIKP